MDRIVASIRDSNGQVFWTGYGFDYTNAGDAIAATDPEFVRACLYAQRKNAEERSGRAYFTNVIITDYLKPDYRDFTVGPVERAPDPWLKYRI